MAPMMLRAKNIQRTLSVPILICETRPRVSSFATSPSAMDKKQQQHSLVRDNGESEGSDDSADLAAGSAKAVGEPAHSTHTRAKSDQGRYGHPFVEGTYRVGKT
jgi:hypothetical protein